MANFLGCAMLHIMPHQPRKIAFFGGTFDPVHLGHLTLALWVQEQLLLDQLLFVPAAVPPHKHHRITPASQRLAMLTCAIAPYPQFGISPLELERPGPSYTFDSMQILRAEYGPEAQLWWVLGADSLLNLKSWFRYQEFPHVMKLAVVSRPGSALASPAEFAHYLTEHLPAFIGHVDWIESPPLAIASSEIRLWRSQGHSCRPLLPAGVWEWIEENGLYPSLTNLNKIRSGLF